MENQIHFELRPDVMENLEVFRELLGKDINTIFNEALAQYFENEQRKLMEKGLADENAMTNSIMMSFGTGWMFSSILGC